MTSIATITAASDKLALKAGEEGEHVFTVNNAAGRDIKLGARVTTEGETPSDWFEVVGESERDFAERAADQIRVRVRVPTDAADGEHQLHLTVFDVDSPGEHFTEGPTVTVKVTAKPQDNDDPFPWWIVGVAAVLLLVGGGLLWWLAGDGGEAVELVVVPNVHRQEVLTAAETLSRKSLTYELKPRRTPDSSLVNRIVDQDPAAGAEVESGFTVTLFVGQRQRVTPPGPNVLELPPHVTRQLENDPRLHRDLMRIQPTEP